MPRVCDSELHEIMCIPKHSLRSGLGARSVLRRSPASGSAERHLPFPHKSAPVGRSISTGDGRRVSAQPRHTGVFLLTNPTSQRRHHGPCSPRCARVWIKFPRLFFFLERNACVRAWEGWGGKDEDNCRFPWMMMSRDERRLVLRAFCSCLWRKKWPNFGSFCRNQSENLVLCVRVARDGDGFDSMQLVISAENHTLL